MSQWAVAALCTAVCRAWERPVDVGVAPGRQPWWPLISRPARHPAPGWRCSVGVTAHAARSGVGAPTPVSPSPHVGPFRGRQQRRGPRTAQVAMPHSGASGLVPAARCRRTVPVHILTHSSVLPSRSSGGRPCAPMPLPPSADAMAPPTLAANSRSGERFSRAGPLN